MDFEVCDDDDAEEEQVLSVEGALHRVETLFTTKHDFLKEDFLQRMEPTIRYALGRVDDDETEYEFQSLAMMNLAAHLCGSHQYSCFVDGLTVLGGVFLCDTDDELPEDDLESTLSVLHHLQNRLYPPVHSIPHRRFYQMNRRADPLLVALVAHVVAQTAVDWDEVASTTKHFVQSSTHMDANSVRVGLAIYGLQQLKRRQRIEGLTMQIVLEKLSPKFSIGIFSRAAGLSTYVASMYITNAVVLVDDIDDQTYSKNVDALSGLLRETGAAHEDAAYSYIETANKSRTAGHTPNALPIEGSGPQERNTLLSPEFVLETHLMLFVARDELSAARRLALKMEGCSWLSSQVKIDAWGRILSYLRQIGMLLLDGNHATPCYERKFQDLTILVMSMGQPLGVDVLCNFFHDFAAEAARNDAATEEEKTYVTLAAQRTLLLLLRNRYSNDEKAVKEWLDVFPNLSYFGSSAVEWAEGFVQRKNPIPPSLLVDGFVDLNAFRNRAINAHRLARVEALTIEEEFQEHRNHMRADEEVCVVDDEEEQDDDEVCVVDDEEEQDVDEVFVVADEEEPGFDEVIDIADNDSDVVEDMEDVESEVDEDDTEELDQTEGDVYCKGEEESHEGNEEEAEAVETRGPSRVWTGDSKHLRASGGHRLYEEEADEGEGREPYGRARYNDDYDFDGAMGPDDGDDGPGMRENEGIIEEKESASDNHDVVEILDDSDDDDDILEESKSVREEQLESGDDAQDADVEQLDDDSDDEARDADAERLDDDSDAIDDDYTPNVELDTSDMQPASANAESHEIEDAEHSEGAVSGDLQPSKKQTDAEDRLDQGYDPDSAGGDTSQAEMHCRLEKGYEPDSASQHDDQDETPFKEMWREASETSAHLETGYEPDTAAGGDISHAEMQDRLEKGYEPDAGSQVDDQEEDVLEEVQRAKKLREAQARLEQGYEPDTAGGDISQAEMQDRLEQGYEPDTTALYTEEEVSEAAQSEDDDNALDEPSREHDGKIDAVSAAQKTTPDQLGALSDDMDAADDRTEVDHGADLSEVEENMSQEAADHGVSPYLEASSTLLAFAYEAQNRPSDENEVLATDLHRNKIDSTHSLLVSRVSPAGRTPESYCMMTSVDIALEAEIACRSTPGNDATHPELESANDDFVQVEHQVSNNNAPERSVDPLQKGHFNHLPGLYHLRHTPPERSLSTIVHLSASEMSDDGGVDEPAKIQEEDVYDEAESDDDPKSSGILPAADPALNDAALAGEEGEDPESEVDAKSPSIPPPVKPSPKHASKAEEPGEEYDAHVTDIRPSSEPSEHTLKAVEEGDEEPGRGQQPNIRHREDPSPECAVDAREEGEDPQNEVGATALDSQTPARPTPRHPSEASENGQDPDKGINPNSHIQYPVEALKRDVATLEEEDEPDNIVCATPSIHQHSVARRQNESSGISPTSAEGGDGAVSSASAVDVKVQYALRALTSNGRSRINPLPAESGEEGDDSENEGDTKETEALVSRGRKGKSRNLPAPTESEEGRGKPSVDIKASPEEVKPPEAAGRKRRPRTQPESKRDVAPTESEEERGKPSIEIKASPEEVKPPEAAGRKRRPRTQPEPKRDVAPTESEEERGKPSIEIKASPVEVKPPEAVGRKGRPRTQPEPTRDVATSDAVSFPRRETRSKTKTDAQVVQQEKPKKRGRQPVKEVESHVAQTKRVRGEDVKGGAETEILIDESEPIVDEPKRRGGKYSVTKSTEATPVTTRRSARARVATVEEEVRDGKEPKSVDGRTRRQSETLPEERKTRKRGRLAVEDSDHEPAVISNKKLSRGRQSKASSEPNVKEKHENQPQARTTRGSGKKAHNESPASIRQSAIVHNAKSDNVEEGVQKAGAQRRNTKGVKKEKESVAPTSVAGRSNTGAPSTDSLQLAKEEGRGLQSRKTRVSSKKSAVAPIEETIVPTRRSARGRIPNSKF